MHDLKIWLEDRPGALADLGDALGRAGISVEGGGAFAVDNGGIAHFLVEDGPKARNALVATASACSRCAKCLSSASISLDRANSARSRGAWRRPVSTSTRFTATTTTS